MRLIKLAAEKSPVSWPSSWNRSIAGQKKKYPIFSLSSSSRLHRDQASFAIYYSKDIFKTILIKLQSCYNAIPVWLYIKTLHTYRIVLAHCVLLPGWRCQRYHCSPSLLFSKNTSSLNCNHSEVMTWKWPLCKQGMGSCLRSMKNDQERWHCKGLVQNPVLDTNCHSKTAWEG